MRYPTLIGPILALSCAAFPCDCNLNIAIPASSTDVSTTYGVGVDSTSTNAQQIKSLSGATYSTGKSSSASLTETAQGELALKWSLVYDPADGDYGTSVSLLLPLTPAWDIKDLSAYSEIDYEIRSEGSAPVSAHMQIGSDLYGDSAKHANAALAQPAWTALTANYKTVKTLTKDLAMNDWYTGSDVATTGWSDSLMTYKIGKAVKNLNFQPKIGWTSSSVIASGATGTLYIRNVKMIGECYCIPPTGTGCVGTGFTIEDFAATKKTLSQNYLGGSWYAYSDTSSNPSKLNDSAVGSSAVLLPAGKTAWAPDATSSLAVLTASLEKDVPASTYLYHRYAGWAGIGTDLPGQNPDGSSNFVSGSVIDSLQSISFDLYAGSALGLTHSIDTAKVRRIIFKVSKASVDDAQAYSVNIPVRQALDTVSNTVCVDVTTIQQPAWYVKNSLGGVAKPFTAEDLTKLSWQIQIEDQADPTKHSSVNNTIAVGNVNLYGAAPAGIQAVHGRSSTALRANYNSTLRLTYRVDGPSAHIEVRSLSGARIASFQESASAQNLSLPVVLSRGTYAVTVQGAKIRQTALLNVAR